VATVATLNVSSRSTDSRARRLSNFSYDPFVLDGEYIVSVEGFIQGIKFPEDHPARLRAFQLFGIKAKRSGRGAKRQFVWWTGQIISYGSPEHYALIERAIRAKLDQNPDAMHALLATKGMVLIHDYDPGRPAPGRIESPYTSLPAEVFCDILSRIRYENLDPQ